jgi:hypothetical protein
MSSLPPISPRLAPAAPQSPNAAAVRDARAMFFRAMGEVPAASPSTPVAKSAAVFQPAQAAAPQSVTSLPGATSNAEDAARLRRPGSLLNILV